jgi:hypothetical protein
MQTKQAKKVTAILSCEEFAKLQGNKDFLLNSQISGIQTEYSLEVKNSVKGIEYAKKIGRYMLKGAEYFKSKQGKAELFKVGLEFTYIDFYCKELNLGSSAIYEYMDLAKLTDEQIKEQTDKGIVNKRKIISACKGKNAEGENAEGENAEGVKVKAEKFSVSMDKENKIIIKGESALTLSQLTLLKKEFARIEKNLKDAKKSA